MLKKQAALQLAILADLDYAEIAALKTVLRDIILPGKERTTVTKLLEKLTGNVNTKTSHKNQSQ